MGDLGQGPGKHMAVTSRFPALRLTRRIRNHSSFKYTNNLTQASHNKYEFRNVRKMEKAQVSRQAANVSEEVT